MKRVIDLTLPIETGMPTCGTPWHQTVKISKMGLIKEVGRNTSKILLGSHSGTHMDAPLHFFDNAGDITTLDVDLLWGEATVVDMTEFKAGDVVLLENVQKLKISKRMIFCFQWYKKWRTEEYYKEFPYFSVEATEYLIQKGMRVMGLDTPSPDDGNAIVNRKNDSPNHKKLLSDGAIIIEYLNNTEALDEKKKYEIAALPMKIMGSDGAPCRIVAREV